MNNTNIIPYDGEAPYIFVSYCHRNADCVMRILAYLTKCGCRVWYDSGINPGDEWPEVIAEHISGCAAFVSFISNEAMESHNCRKEFNYAMAENKPFLCVFLEEVKLTPVMKMQLASVQAINRSSYDSDEAFYNALLKCSCLERCYDKKALKTVTTYFLKRESTSEAIHISHSGFKIGRKSDMCDCAITDNKAVSRVHSIIDIDNCRCFIRDNKSLNNTYVNDKPIGENPVELHNNDRIDIGGEIFAVFCEETEVDD